MVSPFPTETLMGTFKDWCQGSVDALRTNWDREESKGPNRATCYVETASYEAVVAITDEGSGAVRLNDITSDDEERNGYTHIYEGKFDEVDFHDRGVTFSHGIATFSASFDDFQVGPEAA